VWWVARSKR